MQRDSHIESLHASKGNGLLLPVLVLVIGLLATAALVLELKSEVTRREQVRFNSLVSQIKTGIEYHIDRYIAMLHGGAGLFAASQQVTSEEFRAYIEHLRFEERYPEVQGMGFAMRVNQSNREQVAAELRQRANVELWPDSGDGESFNIIYLEPQNKRNAVALGYDMFSEPVRRAAMERARDTGMPAATDMVRLVQEIDNNVQPGFLIYLPVYDSEPVPQALEGRRERLIGYVYSPFRAHDLFQGMFHLPALEEVDFQVFASNQLSTERQTAVDGPAGAETEWENEADRLKDAAAESGKEAASLKDNGAKQIDSSIPSLPVVFDSRSDDSMEQSSHWTTVNLDIADRQWQLRVLTRPQFHDHTGSEKPLYTGAIGVVISILLATVMWLQARTRRLEELRRQAAQHELETRREMEATLVVRNQELQESVAALQKTREELTQQNVELAVTRNTIERERERYRSLFEFAPDGSLVTDPHGGIREANHAAARLLNVPQPELLGRSVMEFVDEDSAESLQVLLQQVMTKGRVERSEIRFRPVNAAAFDGQVTAAIIRDEAGRATALQWLFHDITQLVMEKNFSDAVVASLPGIFYVLDEEGRLVRWNQRLEEVSGYSAEQIRTMNPLDFFAAEDQEFVRERLAENFSDGYITVEAPLRTASGAKIPHLFTGHRTLFHQRPHIVGVGIDITERLRAEQELAQHRAQLEQLVHVRTQELEQSHQRLRLSERMAALGTLSAGLGHDMGNLLLPVRLRLDSLESKSTSHEMKQDIQAIRKSAEYLQRLVNGLRLFALDPNDDSASSQQTNLNEWWADVQPFLKNALPREIEFEYELPRDVPPVRVPRHLLTQAVFNLVQNAGEVMRSRGWGMVRMWALHDKSEGYVRVAVSDNGPGMTEAIRQRCIEPFFTTKPRGLSTGLGLALVHGILNKVGGRLEIESEPGHGATFTLVLPALTSANGQRQGVKAKPRAILSLQDERIQAYVASVLQSLSFQVQLGGAESNGSDADVWITDRTGDGRRVKDFLQTSNRRVIVVGDHAENTNGRSMRGLINVEARPTLLRRTIQEVADDLRGVNRTVE